MKRYLVLLAALLMGTGAAYADSLVTVLPTGTDSVDWSQLGVSYATISNPFSFTTTDGVSGTGTYASGGNGFVLIQGTSWSGNFAAGDFLNYNSGDGAVTLNFSSGFTQIGAQIMENYYGAFTAQICDVNGCFTEDGVSNGAANDSAIYIGVDSSSPIDWATFSITSGTNPNDFAISGVTLDASPAAAPEPESLVLVGTGLCGALGIARRRFQRA